MNELLDTIIPISKTITSKVRNKFDPCLRFKEKSENNKSIHPITKRYEEKIKDALIWIDDMQDVVEYILETMTRLINIYDLKDKNNQNLIFEQIIVFMNYLCLELRSKFLFNTLTNNDLNEFKGQTIWNNINNLAWKWGNKSDSWCYCIHYALFFKKLFDELEKRTNLWTTDYLFLERSDWLNHSWLVVTFNWRNYLVDSSFFNKKFMQPIDEMWKYYNRMKSLNNFYRDDISSDSIQKAKDEYIEHDYNYYKVKIQSSDELLSLLESIPQKVWSISRMYNILDNVLWINFKISNDWIQILETFTYHFDHILNAEELDNISDDKLMDYLFNHISYKTNKDSGKTIKVFDFEKKYIKNTLSYFSDKIDYSSLRKVLSYN